MDRPAVQPCRTVQQSPVQSVDECPECAESLVTADGERRCEACGLIVTDQPLDRRGPRTFPDDDRNRERTGAPLTEGRHDRGLSTAIGRGHDANGNALSERKRRQLHRLRREHSRAQCQSKTERNLSHGCAEIARLVAALGLARSHREQASALFRTAQDAGLLPGRSIEGIAAGAVYAVCRCNELGRTRAEVATVAHCSRARLTTSYNVLNRELDLPTPPQRPQAFLASLASDVALPQRTVRRARALAECAADAGVVEGRHPAGVAAACLELAAAEQGVVVRQADLAAAADVTPVTVRASRDAVESIVATED